MKHLNISLTSIALLTLITSCSQESDVIMTDEAAQNEHHISVMESQNRLISILHGMENNETRGTSLFAQKNITSVKILGKDKMPLTRASENEASYYVFRFGNNEGFAIMSADNRLPDLLAVGEGDPNPDDSTSDIPDSLLWSIPQVPDSAEITPVPDITAPTTPCTYLVPGGLVRAQWGQGEPYSFLAKERYFPYLSPEIELRVQTDAVAVAQLLMTADNHSYFGSGDETLGSIDWDKLYRCRYTSSFWNDSIRKNDINKLYAWLLATGRFKPAPDGKIKYDAVKKRYYLECVMDFTVGMSPEQTEEAPYYDNMESALLGLSFQDVFAKEFTETSISDIITGLSQRKVAIFQDIETYNEPNRNHKTVLADNVMYFDELPEIKYFKINYGKEGAGNGYYLATGFVGKVMYRQPRKVTQ